MRMTVLPKIPGYTIQEKIGEGATAVVYHALQTNLDRDVALKVLKPGLEHDSAYIRRFIKEARTVSKLSCPNIVTIHDVGRSCNAHYIVMERLGETLKDKLKNNRPLPLNEALRIFKPVARALKFAHSKKVVHRDIKPANILFRQDDTPVIVDFGLAKVMDSSSNSTVSKKAIGAGTPGYMSPEQHWGEKIDYLSDIYSLGVVLYEMLSGKSPRRSKNSRELNRNSHIPPLPTELKKFQPLIEQMMAKNKDERLHDLEDAVKQLKRLINGDDVEITGVRPIPRRKSIFPDFGKINTKKQIGQVITIIVIIMLVLAVLYFLAI